MTSYPSKASFSGHETFSFRYPWLKKGFDAASSNPQLFWDEDAAMTELGVGKNMVRSIRHWCLVTGILEEPPKSPERRRAEVRPSEIGKLLLSDEGLDPYLEDPATLWLLHWQIASAAERATTWFWAFNHVHEVEFSKDSLLADLEAWVQKLDFKRVSQGSLRRDIDCFLRTYVPARGTKMSVLEDTLDCPLVELALIQESGDRSTYQFMRGPQESLPNFMFCYAVLDFWRQYDSQRQTLSLHDLTYRAGSPGMLFKMSENSLVERLEGFHALTKGAFSYDETVGVKQVYRHKELPLDRVLKSGYQRALSLSRKV